jgi:hypothetical protein
MCATVLAVKALGIRVALPSAWDNRAITTPNVVDAVMIPARTAVVLRLAWRESWLQVFAEGEPIALELLAWLLRARLA